MYIVLKTLKLVNKIVIINSSVTGIINPRTDKVRKSQQRALLCTKLEEIYANEMKQDIQLVSCTELL